MPDTPELKGTRIQGEDFAGVPPTQTPTFFPDRVFFGRDGLRAGWSLLLYFAMLYILFLTASLLRYEIHQWRLASTKHAGAAQAQAAGQASSDPSRPGGVLLSEGLGFLCVTVATWGMGKIESRPRSVYGLDRRGGLGNFLAGMAWGVAFLSLLIFALRLMGLLVFDARLLFGINALGYAVIWLLGFLLVALFEEYFTRGYLQFTLTRGLTSIYRWLGAANADRWGFWTAALVLSFCFGFSHSSNPGESPLGLLSAGMIGLVFCLALWRTGSLWWAIGFHAAWDWAQSFLYGVADSGTIVQGRLFATHPLGRPILSGGLTGPEGSAFILPILALCVEAILLTVRCSPWAYIADLPRLDAAFREEPSAPVPRQHLDLP